MKIISLLGLVLFISLASFKSSAKSWHVEPEITMRRDMAVGARGFRQYVKSERLTAQNCAEELGKIYQSLYALDPAYFLGPEVREKNMAAMKTPGNNNPLQNFFLARIALRQRFTDWVKNDEFSSYEEMQKCGNVLKMTIRNQRTFEDYYGQVVLKEQGFFDQPEEEQKTKKFRGGFPHTMINPKYDNGQAFPQSKGDNHGSLQNGDILLSRGTAFTSAVISRIGSVDNQFSHLAIVYIADGSIKKFFNREKQWEDFIPGNIYVLEAVLDNGFQVVTLDEYVGVDKARLAHYRFVGNGKFSSEELVQLRTRAAQLLAEQAAENKVPYNFSMNMLSEESLFCSQAISYGYQLACDDLQKDCEVSSLAGRTKRGHNYPFPILATEILKKNDTHYVNQMGDLLELNVEKVFAPADVDSDPQIELVGEWRQYKHIAGRRIHDIIFTKLFQWMEQVDYQLRANSAAISDLGFVGMILSKATEKMPPNTPKGFVDGSLLLGYMVESPGLNKIGRGVLSAALAMPQVQDVLEELESADVNQLKMALSLTEVAIQGAQSVEDSPLEALGMAKDLVKNLGMTDAVNSLTNEEVQDRLGYMKELIESGRFVEAVSFVGLNKEVLKFRDDPEKGYVAKYGYPPTDFIYDRYLEVYRTTACKEYQEGGRVFFHHLFAKDFSGDKSKACDTEILDWRIKW